MEIPEDMQRKWGFAPLGAVDGPIKRAILGENGARVYGVTPRRGNVGWRHDALAGIRADRDSRPERSNLAYGFVRKSSRT
jgi:hypothetical protein